MHLTRHFLNALSGNLVVNSNDEEMDGQRPATAVVAITGGKPAVPKRPRRRTGALAPERIGLQGGIDNMAHQIHRVPARHRRDRRKSWWLATNTREKRNVTSHTSIDTKLIHDGEDRHQATYEKPAL